MKAKKKQQTTKFNINKQRRWRKTRDKSTWLCVQECECNGAVATILLRDYLLFIRILQIESRLNG